VASVEQNTIVESLVVVNWFSHVTQNLTGGPYSSPSGPKD